MQAIDHSNISRSYMSPVQVKLDQPYYDVDIPNAYMFRTGVEDLKKLKKKQKETVTDEMDWSDEGGSQESFDESDW